MDVQLAFVATHKKLVGCGSVNDTLRPGNTDAVGDPSSPEVDGFFAVIAQGGDEQTAFGVDPEMVDASLRVRKGYSARED